jgi:hypothetical protein
LGKSENISHAFSALQKQADDLPVRIIYQKLNINAQFVTYLFDEKKRAP